MDDKKEVGCEPPVDLLQSRNLVLGDTHGVFSKRFLSDVTEAIRAGEMFVDGKGNFDISRRIFEMARSMGTREHFEWINAMCSDPASEGVRAAQAQNVAGSDAPDRSVFADGKADADSRVVFTGADLSQFTEVTHDEAMAVLNNCNVKLFLKVEGTTEDGATT
jgi:hypothetical protein